MRDILRNGTENFSTHLLLAGFFVSEQAFASGKNGNAESLQDALEFQRRPVDVKGDFHILLGCLADNSDITDESFALEQLEELHFDLGPRRAACGAARVLRIAHPGDKIADGVVYNYHSERSRTT